MIETRRGKESTRRGSVMVAALMVVMTVAAMSMGLLQMGVSFSNENLSKIDDERALYLAEAGLAEALTAVRAGETGVIGSSEDPARLGDGLLWVESEDLGNQRTRITSMALVNRGRAAVEAVVAPESVVNGQGGGGGDGIAAIFSDDALEVRPSTIIDSFDSRLGPYGPNNQSDNAVIVSNGQIDVSNSSTVFGDAHPGPDSAVVLANPNSVTGSTLPLSAPLPLPDVATPQIPLTGSGSISGKKFDITLPPGDYRYDEIEVGTQSHLTVEGPARLVVDDWTIRSNSTVTFDSAHGPIDVYVTGDFDFRSNSVVETPTQDALDVRVHFTGDADQLVDLSSNSAFYGVIYGSDAEISVSANFEIFGCCVGRSVDLAANVNIHYDEALGESGFGIGLGGGGDGVESTMIEAWRIVQFPDRRLLLNRTDPATLLGVEMSKASSPAAARSHAAESELYSQ